MSRLSGPASRCEKRPALVRLQAEARGAREEKRPVKERHGPRRASALWEERVPAPPTAARSYPEDSRRNVWDAGIENGIENIRPLRGIYKRVRSMHGGLLWRSWIRWPARWPRRSRSRLSNRFVASVPPSPICAMPGTSHRTRWPVFPGPPG